MTETETSVDTMQTDESPSPPPNEDDSTVDTTSSKRSVKFDDTVMEKPKINLKLMTNGSTSQQDTIHLFTVFINHLQAHFSNEIAIEGSNGAKMKPKKALAREKFTKYFNLQQLNTGTNKKKKTIFIITFTVKTTTPLRMLKRQPTIAKFLHKHQLFLKHHPWRHHQWNTVSIGWLLNKHPNRERETDIIPRIVKRFKDTLQSVEKDIPLFKLMPSTQHFKTSQSQHITTSCFEIHCLREDKQRLENLFSALHCKTPTYVKFSLKYEDPEAYEQLLMIQNDYLHNFRSIKITGVTSHMMFYLSEEFSKLPGITSLTEPWNSSEDGRWLLNTDVKNFKEVGDLITTKLKEWIETLVPQDAYPPSTYAALHPVMIHYFPNKDEANMDRMTEADDDSISMQTYISHTKTYISELYHTTEQDDIKSEFSTPSEIHIKSRKSPPLPTGVRSWSSIVGSSDNDTSDLTTSTIVTPQNNTYASPQDLYSNPHSTSQPTPSPAPPQLSSNERQEFEHLKKEIIDLKQEMQRLKGHSAPKLSHKESYSRSPPVTSTEDPFIRMEKQYQQLSVMFERQQEFLALCMEKMLQVNPPVTEIPPSQPLSTNDTEMEKFQQKTRQSMRAFSSQTIGINPTGNTQSPLNNQSRFRRPQEQPTVSSKPNKESKRRQSVVTTAESTTTDTQSPLSKRHDVKSTPPPRQNTQRHIPDDQSKHKSSASATHTPPTHSNTLIQADIHGTSTPDYGIDAALESAMANYQSPIVSHKHQQRHIHPSAPFNNDETSLQPRRLSLEKANMNK